MKVLILFQIDRKRMIALLKTSLFFSNLATVTIYIFLRVLFWGFFFSVSEQIMAAFKIVSMGAVTGLAFFGVYYIIETIEILAGKRSTFPLLPVKNVKGISKEIKIFSESVKKRA